MFHTCVNAHMHSRSLEWQPSQVARKFCCKIHICQSAGVNTITCVLGTALECLLLTLSAVQAKQTLWIAAHFSTHERVSDLAVHCKNMCKREQEKMEVLHRVQAPTDPQFSQFSHVMLTFMLFVQTPPKVASCHRSFSARS